PRHERPGAEVSGAAAATAERSGGKDSVYGEGEPRLCSVTHDILGDPFWAVYRRGLAAAADRYGCRVRHRAPRQFSPAEMASLLERAVAERPAGLLSTVPDFAAVEAPLRRAVELGIPVIAVNAADPRPPAERIPYLLYVGADDVSGGEALAARLLAGGTPARALCVDHYLIDNACHNARCAGFGGSLRAAGAIVEKLRVRGDDLGAAADELTAYLQAHPDLDCVCTLGPPSCEATIEALRRSGRIDSVRHASFDLAPVQLDAIEAGELTFTVDSQQYLQGYLGVAFLTLLARDGLRPASDVLTGPVIVDRANIATARAGVAAGLR
ncbi:MAG: substrate-binding domain-containing protein, partial [Solirubrobacterales bacterium]